MSLTALQWPRFSAPQLCPIPLQSPLQIRSYVAKIWFFSAADSQRGQWPAPLKRWGLWRHLAGYFNASTVKTADLDPARPYIFAVHPHGILSFAVRNPWESLDLQMLLLRTCLLLAFVLLTILCFLPLAAERNLELKTAPCSGPWPGPQRAAWLGLIGLAGCLHWK